MEKLEVRSDNGLILHKNDLVFLTGEEPIDTSVSYVRPMRQMLNDRKKYYITNISLDPISVSAGGWNWDRRNITKVIKNRKPVSKNKNIVLFNPEDLVI